MDQFMGYAIPIVIVGLYVVAFYFLTKSKFKRADGKNKSGSEELKNIDLFDPLEDVIVNVEYIPVESTLLKDSIPYIVIDRTEKFDLIENKITLRLKPKFRLSFGIPYLTKVAFKYIRDFRFELNYTYDIKFTPAIFAFSKPHVEIVKTKNIE